MKKSFLTLGPELRMEIRTVNYIILATWWLQLLSILRAVTLMFLQCSSLALSQTGSTLLRTNMSPLARCTLGLSRHSPAIFIKILYAISARVTQGFTSKNID